VDLQTKETGYQGGDPRQARQWQKPSDADKKEIVSAVRTRWERDMGRTMGICAVHGVEEPLDDTGLKLCNTALWSLNRWVDGGGEAASWWKMQQERQAMAKVDLNGEGAITKSEKKLLGYHNRMMALMSDLRMQENEIRDVLNAFGPRFGSIAKWVGGGTGPAEPHPEPNGSGGERATPKACERSAATRPPKPSKRH